MNTPYPCPGRFAGRLRAALPLALLGVLVSGSSRAEPAAAWPGIGTTTARPTSAAATGARTPPSSPPGIRSPKPGEADRPLTGSAGTATGRIRLQRKGTAAVAASVEQGYQAYLAGAYALAERHYQAQLVSEPTNRDALLGLAAIALRQGRPAQAREHYRRLLAANPADGRVEVALLGLAGDGEAELREGRLKALLETTAGTEAAAALGQLMAAQRRWQEARSYYAQASRAEPWQADLAYDLAVSLDALGERRQAALGYAAALAQPEQGRSFDPAVARARRQALEAQP